ncbi:polysaccharide pyruvyl transferase [Limnospira maxima CS-328]|uniref:Polysaccharide pyruvyl transferase n=2 Tax=Limnospira TaxID=2596745 RepID=B5W7Q9_LIMMA|nr:polysaccharide pyruvyl transferase [Limnospira maxima CS-328]
MAELDFPGWELSQIPDDANIISKAWIEHYANGDRLDPVQIESLSDRAQVHGELLQSLINS